MARDNRQDLPKGLHVTKLDEEFVLFEWSCPTDLTTLTSAEREVITAALRGLSNQEIARLRKRTSRTIANQMRSAFAKLGVKGRKELYAQVANFADFASRRLS